VLVSDVGGEARLWDAATLKPLGPPLPGKAWPAGAVAISPDGQRLVTANGGGVSLWDRKTRRRLQHRPSPFTPARAVFYPDGQKVLLTAGSAAHEWDLTTGRLTGRPPFCPEGDIGSVALSPDGRTALATGPDQVGRLRDVETGHVIGPRLSAVGAGPVAFCANGRLLAVGGQEGKTSLWPVHPPLAGAPEQLRLRVEVLTGLELEAQGTVQQLSEEALQQRRRRLRELGEGVDTAARP
jgi:WD40 repeat protein